MSNEIEQADLAIEAATKALSDFMVDSIVGRAKVKITSQDHSTELKVGLAELKAKRKRAVELAAEELVREATKLRKTYRDNRNDATRQNLKVYDAATSKAITQLKTKIREALAHRDSLKGPFSENGQAVFDGSCYTPLSS